MAVSQSAPFLGATEIDPDLPDVTLADVIRDQEVLDLKGMSVWRRMVLSYKDMRRTTRVLIEEDPSEQRLLFFVLMSDVIFFLSRTLSLVIAPSSSASKMLPMEIGVWLVAILLIRTATLYGFSSLVAGTTRVLGGQGSWRDTRAAVFWASLVAAPIGVIGSLVSAGLAHLEAVSPLFAADLVALPPLWIGVVAFVYFLSAGVAEAQRFQKTTPTFIAFSALTLLLSLAGIFVYARYLA